MKAEQFLQKLRVRPGLQMTTHNVSLEPYVARLAPGLDAAIAKLLGDAP